MKLGFIGAGNMSGAIIGGIVGSKLMESREIAVFDILEEKRGDYRSRGFTVFDSVKSLVESCDAFVIAVKPQKIVEVMPEIKAAMTDGKLVISIVAGMTAEAVKQGVGCDCRLVLVMPNTPLLVGCGASALIPVPPATQADFEFVKSLFESAGVAARIPDGKMNEIIPVNGSSPAFYYYFTKLIVENAEKAGIPADIAYPLICESMIGSAKMMLESGKTPQELIDMVCSPGGATLAGLKALDDNGFTAAVGAAYEKCVGRAYELAELSAETDKRPAEKPEAAVEKKTNAPWYEEAVMYQIYPTGFCGAPETNDGNPQNRISKVIDWIPHMLKTGVNTVFFNPVFESDSHGYDTRDYSRIDCRLGTNSDFARVCAALHDKGLRVVLDGVFNHVGRGFWAFQDVVRNRQHSQYKDWFYIDFNRDSNYNDTFWYEGWEGHFELVKLNLDNSQVRDHLFGCIGGWIEQFGIDGLRLDVAYMLNEDFMRALRGFVKSLQPDFFLLGEAIHGDYNRIMNPSMLDSCTNYECYKGLYSSVNDRNMFELAHSLNRQFGPEQWTLYKGLHLSNFVDNHDVSRIASQIKDEKNLPTVYALLFGMPGIPCVYYGSEWGEKADKTKGSDTPLRPCFDGPRENPLTEWIAKLARIHTQNPCLSHGGYKQLYLTNLQFAFLREYGDSRVIVAVNVDSQAHEAHITQLPDTLEDLLSGEKLKPAGKLDIPPNSAKFYRC